MDGSICLDERDAIYRDMSKASLFSVPTRAALLSLSRKQDTINIFIYDPAEAEFLASLLLDGARLLREARGEVVEPARCPHCGAALQGDGTCPHGVLAAAEACAIADRGLCPECGLSDDGCNCRYWLSEAGERVLDEPAADAVPAIVGDAYAADLAGVHR